ncbi:MAG: glutamine--fructose-6-phosphate transaminase (isomerizing), partial [Alphaproteobacteria bacterium]|nr:glutamine--fructose-6-phosphate transaminase (isomerizing) [Alphaproteobacteria bacterium]
MCGIVGILSKKDNVANLLVESLKRLEYRGYDSAGVATLHNDNLNRRRAEGKLFNLAERLEKEPLSGSIGIGHTRWATHGTPVEKNAHPHISDGVAVVHNGIIENYQEIKDELIQSQFRFESDSDTEVIAHLVTHYIKQGKKPREAVDAALDRLKGAFSLAMIFRGENDLMIGARCGTPLAVGYGDGEMFLASDSYALAPLTNKICFLEDGDRVVVTRAGAEIRDGQGKPANRNIHTTAQSGAITGKGDYRHFMLKEIHEQPAVIGETLNTFINPATGHITLKPELLALANVPRITVAACGTAWLAGFVAKYWLEQTARIPVELDIASEFRYREAPMPKGGAALFISQSGETLDTLEALRYARRQEQTIVSILNTIESTIERESDHVLRTLAGPEIGVASTKAFTTQLTTLACLTIALARKNGAIDETREKELTEALREVPARVADILAHSTDIETIARDIAEARDVLYLGRGTSYPIALEGALKLKEISYIHAEGYASGEMKHGPIALIDENVPVIVVAPHDNLFEKSASNAEEVIARGGKVLLISNAAGIAKLKNKATWTIEIPDIDPFVAPILYTLPVQLLAYHTAVIKGTDVDQPRNLAKSVTVE